MKLIPLTQGKFAKVDDLLYPILANWKWNAQRNHTRGQAETWYARRWVLPQESGLPTRFLRTMHQEILATSKGELIDHKSGDGLDNQVANLRIVSTSENNTNSHVSKNCVAGFKAVEFHRQSGKWGARPMIDGKRRRFGLYDTAEEAAHVADEAVRAHGDKKAFRRYNFPTPNERSALR